MFCLPKWQWVVAKWITITITITITIGSGSEIGHRMVYKRCNNTILEDPSIYLISWRIIRDNQ